MGDVIQRSDPYKPLDTASDDSEILALLQLSHEQLNKRCSVEGIQHDLRVAVSLQLGVVTCLVAIPSAFADTADWTQWGGPSRDLINLISIYYHGRHEGDSQMGVVNCCRGRHGINSEATAKAQFGKSLQFLRNGFYSLFR